jgi:hypothetical protein
MTPEQKPTMEVPEHIKQKIEYNSPHPDAVPKPCIYYWKMGAGFGYSLAQQEIKERDVEIAALRGFRDHLLNEIERLKGLIKQLYFNNSGTTLKNTEIIWQQFKTDNNL